MTSSESFQYIFIYTGIHEDTDINPLYINFMMGHVDESVSKTYRIYLHQV